MVDTPHHPDLIDRMYTLETRLALIAAALEHETEFTLERLAAASRAVDVAMTANDKRLDGMNEFRTTLSDQAGRFVTRDEYHAAHESLVARLEEHARMVTAKFDEVSQPNYLLLGTILSAFFVLISSAWVVIGLKVDNAIAPAMLTSSADTAALREMSQHILDLSAYYNKLRDQMNALELKRAEGDRGK